MTSKKTSKQRRKLLSIIAASSGAIVAGNSLPESWSRPVVDSVMLPAHAQTSPCTLVFSLSEVVSACDTGDFTTEDILFVDDSGTCPVLQRVSLSSAPLPGSATGIALIASRITSPDPFTGIAIASFISMGLTDNAGFRQGDNNYATVNGCDSVPPLTSAPSSPTRCLVASVPGGSIGTLPHTVQVLSVQGVTWNATYQVLCNAAVDLTGTLSLQRA